MKKSEIHLVYKIIGLDGRPYIGITSLKNLGNRKWSHKNRKSSMFGENFIVEPIYMSTDREHIEDMEEYFISEYDSYNNGHNLTKTGKGNHNNSERFNTMGYKFSDESKQKMRVARHRLKEQGKLTAENLNTPEIRAKNRERMIKYNNTRPIHYSFEKSKMFEIYLDMLKFQIDDIRFISNDTKNSDKRYFSTYSGACMNYFADVYGVSYQCILDILRNRTYKTCGACNQKLSWDQVTKMREDFNNKIKLPDNFCIIPARIFNTHLEAYAARFHESFKMCRNNFINILQDKKRKYINERDKAIRAAYRGDDDQWMEKVSRCFKIETSEVLKILSS
jgi:hypothetical protein